MGHGVVWQGSLSGVLREGVALGARWSKRRQEGIWALQRAVGGKYSRREVSKHRYSWGISGRAEVGAAFPTLWGKVRTLPLRPLLGSVGVHL